MSLGLPAEDSAFSVWPLIVAIALGIIALAVLYKFATTMDRTSGLVPFEDIQQADSSLTKEVLFYEYFFFKSLSRNFPCFTKKYVNIPSEKYIYVHKYVYICVYTYLCKMDEHRSYAGLS